MKRVCILGSTGSVGCNTLEVIARHPGLYRVFALTANRSVDQLIAQCIRFAPSFAVVSQEQDAKYVADALKNAAVETRVLAGVQSLCRVAESPEVDIVMAAIVGAAGLLPTMAGVRAGKKILLANKESLVMAGGLFMQAVEKSGALLLPIDSEHNAIFQCLPPPSNGQYGKGVRKILLSGSGGPFRKLPLDQLDRVTPDQACKHPNWDMGRKISVDSATMMNKGLELVEACWLFGVAPQTVEIIIHPQSIVHSLVEYIDGSVLAQLATPDMKIPIAFGLAWPERIESGASPLDLARVANLEFESPDLARFPCLELAMKAAAEGKNAPIVLNAANEVAVDKFLNEQIGYTDIARVVEAALNAVPVFEVGSIEEVMAVDAEARAAASAYIGRRISRT